MSATGTDRAYYAAVEAAFIRRRGTPFLLSPRDFALLQQWRALGIPLEIVERGIDEAFSRREERGAVGRINALAYCRDAVLVAWERAAQTAVGKGSGRGEAPTDAPAALARLQGELASIARRRPDLAPALEAAGQSLERLGRAGKPPDSAEASLARLDKKLAGELYEAMPEADRSAIDGEVERLLAGARVRMDEAAAEKTARAVRRRAVRERLALPRLTLLP